MNKVIISGNLTKEPELTEAGSSVICKNSIAINRKYKDVEETLFFDIEVWNKTAEFLVNYATKGTKVLVEGELRNNSYTNKEGVNISKTVINVFNLELAGGKQKEQLSLSKSHTPSTNKFDVNDDDLPF